MADRVPTLVAARILAACRARRRAASPADLATRLDRRFVVTPTSGCCRTSRVRRGRRARSARHRHRQEPPALPGAFNRTAIASVARTRHKRALTCRPGRDQTCDLDYKAPDGSAGNEISEPFGLRRSVTASLRVGSFSGRGSQTGTSGTRAATCAWPPPRIDAYSSLIPATRRESSRTYRKYEVPNHVVTQNDWQPPRRVENPRPKSEGRRFDPGPGHRDFRIRSAIEHPRIVAPAHRTACRTGAFCQDA